MVPQDEDHCHHIYHCQFGVTQEYSFRKLGLPDLMCHLWRLALICYLHGLKFAGHILVVKDRQQLIMPVLLTAWPEAHLIQPSFENKYFYEGPCRATV